MRYAREYCYSPLDGKLVHRRITPQRYVAGTHLYTWVKRDKVEKNPLSKETTRQAKLELRTSRSEVRGVNRSATHASTYDSPYFLKYSVTFLNRANTDRFVSPRVLVSVYLSPGWTPDLQSRSGVRGVNRSAADASTIKKKNRSR